MKLRISTIYSWFIRLITSLLPNVPLIMRFRGWLYSLMMHKCGRDFQVTSSAIINSLALLDVGDHVYIAHNSVIMGTSIIIESNVLIGPNCVISSSNHILNKNSFRFGKLKEKGVLLKKGSWVSANCSVVGGSELPEQSILAAGSVLSKKFTEVLTMYGGVPAKSIGKVQSSM